MPEFLFPEKEVQSGVKIQQFLIEKNGFYHAFHSFTAFPR
jgi:hypothetical protein